MQTVQGNCEKGAPDVNGLEGRKKFLLSGICDRTWLPSKSMQQTLASLAVGEVEETRLEKLSVAPEISGMADDLRVLWHVQTVRHAREE